MIKLVEMASSGELKEESCLICGGGCGESPPPSRKQISFLLSRILELPQEQIDFYSEFYSSQGEESLVKICTECSSNFVYECVQVRRELAEIQKRLEEADRKLISKIKESVDEDGGPGDTSGFVNVTHEIRSFVYNRSYQNNSSAEVKSEAPGTVLASVGQQKSTSVPNKIRRIKEVVADFENNLEPSSASRENIEGTVEEALIPDIKSEVLEPNLAPEEPENSAQLDFLNEDDIEECGEELPQRPRRQKRKCSLEVVEPPDKCPKKGRESPPGKTNETPVKRRKKSLRKKLAADDVLNKIPTEPEKLKKLCVFCDLCREKVPRESILPHVRDHVKDYTLKCQTPNCPRAFCSITHYNNHVFNCKPPGQSTPNPRFPTVCEVCGFQAVSQVGLLRHLQFLHENSSVESFQSLPCPVTPCPEVFSHQQTVYHHISLKHAAPRKNCVMTSGDGMQPCRTCSKSFPQDKILEHFVTDHAASADLVVSCSHCPYLSLNRDEFLEHLKIHFRLGVVVGCDLCPSPINFSRYDLFRKHYFKSHQIGEAFPCQQCEAFFVNAKQLTTHLKRVHERSLVQRLTKRFKCDECPENDSRFYLHERNVRDHKIKVHGADPYKCSSCPETFTTWVDLKTHEKRHNNVAVREYRCEIPGCGRLFPNKTSLTRHMTSSIQHFGKTNAVTCPTCGAGFNDEKRLKIHVAQVHASERKFLCTDCGAGFKTGPCLTKHARIHTGELPYQCQHCPNRFRESGTLWNHVKIVHMGIKRQRK